MHAYDSLPPKLRAWMANAALPWSPASCLTIWRRAANPDEALTRLRLAEERCLQREGRRRAQRDRH